MRDYNRSKVKETTLTILACVLFFSLVFAGVYIKLLMFDGDARCLFVKCVIVK